MNWLNHYSPAIQALATIEHPLADWRPRVGKTENTFLLGLSFVRPRDWHVNNPDYIAAV